MAKTALLLMDLQNMIVDRYVSDKTYVPRLQEAAKAARKAGLPIIYVVVKFRPGFPEISANNKLFGGIKSSGMQIEEGHVSTEVTAALAPQEGDVVVTKRRVGAFSGSDLDVVLRAQQIDHIVLAGIATSGVVLSTLRLAADLDYKITVLSDGCLDRDETVHSVLMEKVFPGQADVITVKEWMDKI